MLSLNGCSGTPATAPFSGTLNIAGRVFGGEQPVTGSTVQLYAVGTAGDASAATALIAGGVKTDGAGNFDFTAKYTCPSASTYVYMVATGGNPGLASGTNNSALALMAALGDCGSITATTNVWIDEVTTVGSVAALYPYMTDYGTLGFSSSDPVAFSNAFSTVAEYVNTVNGQAPGPALPSGYYGYNVEIDTLADILATCINTTGTTSACSSLFSLAKPSGGSTPTDTIAAIDQIFRNPTQNVTALFQLITSTGPYQPSLTSAPSTWAIGIGVKPTTPVFSQPSGTYPGAISVSITDTAGSASIYYTTDGTTPSASSKLYTGSFTVSATETVHAIAISGQYSSSVASVAYSISSTATSPIINYIYQYTSGQSEFIEAVGSGFGTSSGYNGTSSYFAFRDNTKGWQAGYGADAITVDVPYWSNTVMEMSSLGGYYGNTQYGYTISNGDNVTVSIWNATTGVGPINCTLIVGAYGADCTQQPTVAAPIFTPGAGTYPTTQSITLTSATANSYFYYTLDGSTPTIASFLYSGPIQVTSSETINAIATDYTGYTSSAVATAAYTINAGSGIISTYSGGGSSLGDGGLATSASMTSPNQSAFDPSGNLYIADYGGNRIRKVTPAGIISTFAGNGTGSSTGDGGLPASATVNGPNGIAIDYAGNIFISEEHGCRIRWVSASTGKIATYAGTGTCGYSGSGVVATTAQLNFPEGIAVDQDGYLYIADTYNNKIRYVDPYQYYIYDFAGTGTGGYNGDNIAPTSANLSTPYGIAVDNAFNVFISDTYNNRIRKISSTTGLITTVAGNGSAAFADNAVATSGSINTALGIAVDTSGNLYIGDQNNYRIRLLSNKGVLSTIAGNGVRTYAGDGGSPLAASLVIPEGVALDPWGNVYIGDGGDYRIRKITYNSLPAIGRGPGMPLSRPTGVSPLVIDPRPKTTPKP